MFELINIMLKWVTELVVIGIHNIYTVLFIALETAAVVFIMERFLKFDRSISWLTGLLVFIWLSENIIVKRASWSGFLVPSVVGILLLIIFIGAVLAAIRRILEPQRKIGKMARHGWPGRTG